MHHSRSSLPRRVIPRLLRGDLAAAAALLVAVAASHAQAGPDATIQQGPKLIHPGAPSLEQGPAPVSTRPQQTEAHRLVDRASYLFRIGEYSEGDENARADYFERAEELAEAALELDDDIAQAHFLLFAVRGRRILEDGVQVTEVWQFPELKSHLSRTLDLDPDHAHALAAKGGLLLDLPPLMGGDPAAAVGILERAIELNPMGLRTRITLARALVHHDRNDEAKQQLLTAAHYACTQRRGSVLAEAEKLLQELAPTVEVAEVSDNESLRAPWEPRHADAATTPPDTP